MLLLMQKLIGNAVPHLLIRLHDTDCSWGQRPSTTTATNYSQVEAFCFHSQQYVQKFRLLFSEVVGEFPHPMNYHFHWRYVQEEKAHTAFLIAVVLRVVRVPMPFQEWEGELY